jgi:hypothetical protein
MIKKKKKLSYSELQKQQLLQQIQYKNLFKQKLREVCIASGDATLYDLIPSSEVDFMFYMRSAPLKIKVVKGAKIQKRLIEVMEAEIKRSVTKTLIEMIPGSGRGIPLTDYALVGNILELVLQTEAKNIRERERFAEFMLYAKERFAFYFNMVSSVCENVCTVYNDLSSHTNLYTFSFDLRHCIEMQFEEINKLNRLSTTSEGKAKGMQLWESMDTRLHPIVNLYTMPVDIQQVEVDGEIRSVTSLSIVHYEKEFKPVLFPIFILLGRLDSRRALANMEVPIYVQQHAFHRIMERTGSVVPSFAIMQLYTSMLNPEIITLSDTKFLIEFRLVDHKIGYLLCELTQGILLVRTFLFITNSGTPEGDKLTELTNLQKEDRKYLAIDNLHSLLSSDILDNETLCKLFRKAGCQRLLELCAQVKNSDYLKTMLGISGEKTALSELMTEYLNPQADNDEYVIGE